jgi:hypothetical protein
MVGDWENETRDYQRSLTRNMWLNLFQSIPDIEMLISARKGEGG